MYSGGLKLYWTRMCERAEIYLVTQCREAKKKKKKKKSKNSKCIFFLITLSLPPKLSLPVTVSPLLLGTLSHAEHHPSPFNLDAALGPLASCGDRQLQLKVFGVLSFILFPTLLIPILRHMPLAFKSQM